MKGALFIGADLTTDQELDCDVCIVGSGAGGAVLAAGLVERGLDVVVLEEGGYYTRTDFNGDEGQAFDRLYQDRGTRATADVAITILQGRSVGGGTTVNWTTCFRTPERILDHWAEQHGVEGLSKDALEPHWRAVEERLGIEEWPLAQANRNNRILAEGCKALGWEFSPLRRNVRGCVDSGYCGLGCPVGAKQAMHRTFIQDGLDLGLRLYADVRADRLEHRDRQVEAVVASVLDRSSGRPTGVTLRVRPKVCVSSGGAINGPALLLRSGLDAAGRVGRRTFLHPVVAMPAFFEEPIHPFYGAPQSVSSHQFADRGADKVGFFMEVAPIQPVVATLAFSGFGASQREFMKDLPNMGGLLALAIDGIHPDDEGGQVSLRSDGRLRVDYPVQPHLAEAFQAAHQALAQVGLAAGASQVLSLHLEPQSIRSEADLPALASAAYGAFEHPIATAHQMGGCSMGGDRNRSVVSSELQHHDADNLFVVDGSVFPTSLGVNPSLSIYGLSHWARERVAAAV